MLYERLLFQVALLKSFAAVAEIIMVAGYFVYAIILYGNVATAAAGIFGNAIQGAVGLIAGVLLTVALEKAGTKKLLGFDK